MGTFSVTGRTAGTGATADHAIAGLWNPDGAKRIRLWEFGVFKTGNTATRCVLAITTARGTPGSTVTPGADNSWDADDVPPSGALLDLAAYSAQPTLGSPRMIAHAVGSGSGSEGSGTQFVLPYGLVIPPGRGVAILTGTTTAWPPSDVYAVWEDA